MDFEDDKRIVAPPWIQNSDIGMSENKEAEKKNKKINHMGLAEVEAALKKTEENMKGLTSKYALALLDRKAELQKA